MSKKKFVAAGAVVGSVILAQSAFAAEAAVTPSENALSVQSGETVHQVDAVPAYLYQDNNYFMLRDMGKMIGYQVDWDESAKKITMIKDRTAQNFDGLSAVKQAENVKKDRQTIVIDGNEYKDMECLNIDGYHYFKLRDLAEAMDFICGWDNGTNTIMLTIGKESTPDVPKPTETSISVDRFLDPELNQKVIEEDVTYVAGSKDYREIEAYIKANIDKDFRTEDYIVTEDDVNGLVSGYNSLIMRLDVNGVSANFGYLVTCLNGKAALITFIGEKNAEFDMTKVETQQISDEEAKQKAIEADGYDYEVEEQRIYRYFDMKELKNKCEVETVYIDDGGHYFATSHTF